MLWRTILAILFFPVKQILAWLYHPMARAYTDEIDRWRQHTPEHIPRRKQQRADAQSTSMQSRITAITSYAYPKVSVMQSHLNLHNSDCSSSS